MSNTPIIDYKRVRRLDAMGEQRASAELLRQLAALDVAHDEEQRARKLAAERRKAIESRIRELRTALETGELVETARCYERGDPDRGVVEYVLVDGSGEVWDAREMTPRERQGGFGW